MTDLLPKPMLADEKELHKLTFPLYASTKLDGIRCMLHPHPNKTVSVSLPLSRSLKPIQNRHISSLLATLPPGLDGELGVISSATGAVDFRSSTASVMRRDGTPDFTFFVFDNWLDKRAFRDRYAKLLGMELPKWVNVVTQKLLTSKDEIEPLFEAALKSGNEGLILRHPHDLYMHGSRRAMYKVKPWKSAECTILGVVEEMHNGNEAETNELGRTKRSSAKAGKTGKGRVGVFVCEDKKNWPGVTFEAGGLTDAEKKKYWEKPPIGELWTYDYLVVGGYDKPRHAGLKGPRHPDDL